MDKIVNGMTGAAFKDVINNNNKEILDYIKGGGVSLQELSLPAVGSTGQGAALKSNPQVSYSIDEGLMSLYKELSDETSYIGSDNTWGTDGGGQEFIVYSARTTSDYGHTTFNIKFKDFNPDRIKNVKFKYHIHTDGKNEGDVLGNVLINNIEGRIFKDYSPFSPLDSSYLYTTGVNLVNLASITSPFQEITVPVGNSNLDGVLISTFNLKIQVNYDTSGTRTSYIAFKDIELLYI